MEEIGAIVRVLKEIDGRYGISTEELSRLEAEFREMKVCTPLIGRFSSGKSALLNAFLGYSEPILAEDVAPETAVPVELACTENEEERPVTIIRNDGKTERCTLDEYRERELDAGTVRCVRMALRNRALGRIPDIQLVDMPGFDAGIEMHNRSIDGYVGRSMAYLLVFPADDMSLRKTMTGVLRELCRYGMPVEVVITKRDKVESEEAYRESRAHLEDSLKKCLGDRELDWCSTSRNEGQIDSFSRMLAALQDRARDLLLTRQKELLRPELDNALRYLRARLNGSSLTESELAGQEDRLRREMSEKERASRERSEGFRNAIPGCISAVSREVRRTLQNSEAALITLIRNRQDITPMLNGLVRQSVAEGIQNHYLPLVERYLQDIAAGELEMNVDAGAVMGSFDVKKNSVVDPIVTGVGTALMTGLPMAGALLGGLYAVIGMLIHKRRQKEAEEKIRGVLNDSVFPEVLRQVEDVLRREIGKQADALEKEISCRREAREAALNKSLADLRQQIQEEQTEKERSLDAMRKDIKRLEEIRNGL